mmetsp:Transcript_22909/g.48286  ORF Transcript_22909/g.48286 Transcript_22909/m.48286 type:complete len:219 (-) Transcript_22909:1012-1668(-)
MTHTIIGLLHKQEHKRGNGNVLPATFFSSFQTSFHKHFPLSNQRICFLIPSHPIPSHSINTFPSSYCQDYDCVTSSVSYPLRNSTLHHDPSPTPTAADHCRTPRLHHLRTVGADRDRDPRIPGDLPDIHRLCLRILGEVHRGTLPLRHSPEGVLVDRRTCLLRLLLLPWEVYRVLCLLLCLLLLLPCRTRGVDHRFHRHILPRGDPCPFRHDPDLLLP